MSNAEYYQRHKERIKAHVRNYAKTNRRAVKDTKLKRLFGITMTDYEAKLAAQSGRCAGCGVLPGTKALAVDHCHTTGKIRGLLCSNCNNTLGQVRDDVMVLRNLADYLVRPPTHAGTRATAQ